MPELTWIGKDKVINHHLDVPFRTLERQYSFDEKGEHKEDNGSKNMIIHGDNLEALKALLPKYEGSVDCIYIDPPYNTAKSSNKNKAWVYSDSVDDPTISKWMNNTVGDEGEDLTRHDKWLCMMYPRLKLLYKLLSDEGVIFISIDDNESHTLRCICDEIFGGKNLIAQFVWRSDGNFDNQAKIKKIHEYILCYGKNQERLGLPKGIAPEVTSSSKVYKDEIRNTVVKNGPKNPMSKIQLKAGFPCVIDEGIIPARSNAFPIYEEDLIIKNHKLTNEVYAESGWASKSQLLNFMSSGFNPVLDTKNQETTFEISQTGAIELVKKRGSTSHVLSILQGLGSTQNMSSELAKMELSFDFPKPVSLIEYLIGFYGNKENYIILDSFAGSGTTAHAVLNANNTDGGKRQFILIELGDYAESLTALRVKNVIAGYEDGKNKVDGIGGSFSYYELGSSVFLENGSLNPEVDDAVIIEYVWYSETGCELKNANGAYLGKHNDVGYYFFRNKTFNYKLLASIKDKAEGYVVYADKCAFSEEELAKYNITFKKISRDIRRV